ncbi:MAG: nitroreductase family deazaflavin-dependent oxidoreductase [Actinobacteria bacterium]|nr:nitroreductase family deazaflavin-dependent oxidoreductase [Actinomycetota bacterium]
MSRSLSEPRSRRRLIRSLSRLHLGLQRLSGGRLGGRVAGMPVLLLTTTGRRSGKPRTTPLTFFRSGSELVIVASNGGADREPDWSLNLRQRPVARVQIGAEQLAVQAREASADERSRLWPTITGTYAGYARYERRTTRTIPLFILTPIREA